MEIVVANRKKVCRRNQNDWCVYLLQCCDGTLYCGITNDLPKRMETHKSGKGAKYTRGRCPVTLVALQPGMNESQARKLEIKVKKQRKNDKVEYLSIPYEEQVW